MYLLNPQFGSTGATVAIAHRLRDQRLKQQNSYYVCPLERMNLTANNLIKNSISSAIQPSIVRFAGSQENDIDQYLNVGEEGLETWAMAKVADNLYMR